MIAAVTQLCTVLDDFGGTVQLSKPAQRIVSLSPDLTESLFAIGAGEHVVGVIRESDYPLKASQLTKIGSYASLDLEKIYALHPDLIVTWGNNFPRQMAEFKKWGLPVYVSNPKRLTDIPRTLKNLGCLAGTQKQANQVANEFSARVEKLSQQYHSTKPIRVFYQLGSYSLLTINHESWINEIISLCGGENLFANIKLPTAEITWEAVITANPEIIISDAQTKTWQMRWQKWQTVSAVKNKKLYSIHPDLIDRPGPRLIEGAETICALIHLS